MARKQSNRGIFFRAKASGEVIGPNGAPGAWWIRFTDGAGLLHREKAGTLTAARALVERRRTEKRQGIHFPENMRVAKAVTLREICDSYLLYCRASGVRTIVRIEVRLREIVSLLGNGAAAAVTPADLERLKLRLVQGQKTKSRRPSSINRYLIDVRAAYGLAVRAGVLDRSPFARGVRLVPENNQRVRELSPSEEARIMLALLPDPPALRPCIAFAIVTGARAGELAALKWADVSKRDGTARLAETKSGKAQTLMLSSAALRILAGLPLYGPHVFAWPDGRPLSRDYLSHNFTRAARKAGVADARLHDTRHTFATRVRRAGGDLAVLRELLRHSSARMSERYSHVSRADLRRAVEAVESTTEVTPELAPASPGVRQGKGRK